MTKNLRFRVKRQFTIVTNRKDKEMKQIRRGVFETNSSSTHSISISSNDADMDNTPIKSVEMGEFGWDWAQYDEPEIKLSYALVRIQYSYDYDEIPSHDYKSEESADMLLSWLEKDKHVKWLHEMVTEFTGSDFEIRKGYSNFYPIGYIDHQSVDNLNIFWSDDEEKFKENMKKFIFDRNCKLITGNDNSY